MIFRGREMAHRDLAFQQMQKICAELKEGARPDAE